MDTSKNEWVEWGKAIAVALVLAILVRSFLFTSYEVKGESMAPNVLDGERFIINKISYEFTEPNRFDLIVFRATETDDYIKRVIGLPGDIVQVRNDVLYINNDPIEEPYLEEGKAAFTWGNYTSDFAVPEMVPKDHVFVLGDNRPNSLDSRRLGFIPMDRIIGKVNLRFWPLTEIGVVH